MDALSRAKQGWKDAKDKLRETHQRMLEDLKFSNPAMPEQWDPTALTARKGRPCLTFDRTNQFLAQVVNDARQNKPSIQVLPADDRADIKVAEKLNGLIRHIEYQSRAGIAYDLSIEHAARIGLGWLRPVPEVINEDTNEQEIRIKRVHDPFAAMLDCESVEPDGMDAMAGYITSDLSEKQFKRLYPKAKLRSFDEDGWFGEDTVRICESFEVEEDTENRIEADLGGYTQELTEDEYWQFVNQSGIKPRVLRTFMVPKRTVKWFKMTGAEILEETVFPASYVPLIPVIGNELWIEGKRYLCGMVRLMRQGQQAYNYERSAQIEAVALQPKAPFVGPLRAFEGLESHWLNTGNPLYLPFNDLDPDSQQPIAAPQRQSPPMFPAAFAQGAVIASQDMEAAVGMFKANLGQQGNETSGRAIMARQREGDTATFHYIDNLSRSIEQLGRIVVEMIPAIYDTKRQARILADDGQASTVLIDPNMPEAVRAEGKSVVAINPGVGKYDVRVKVGPSYTSLRQQTAEQLANILQASPQMLPILGDVWVKAQDWPDADKVARRLSAMLPDPIKALEAEDGPDIPPEVAAQMQAMQQQLMQLQQALQAADQQLQAANAELSSKRGELELKAAETQIKAFDAETDRLKVMADVQRTDREPVQPMVEAPVPTQSAEVEKSAPLQVVLPGMDKIVAGEIGQLAQSVTQANAVMTDSVQQALGAIANSQSQTQMAIAALIEQMSRPKEVVRGPDGKIVGVQ